MPQTIVIQQSDKACDVCLGPNSGNFSKKRWPYFFKSGASKYIMDLVTAFLRVAQGAEDVPLIGVKSIFIGRELLTVICP